MGRVTTGAGAITGLGVFLASSFATSIGLSVHQQRIGFALGIALIIGSLFRRPIMRFLGRLGHRIPFRIVRIDQRQGDRPGVQQVAPAALPTAAPSSTPSPDAARFIGERLDIGRRLLWQIEGPSTAAHLPMMGGPGLHRHPQNLDRRYERWLTYTQTELGRLGGGALKAEFTNDSPLSARLLDESERGIALKRRLVRLSQLLDPSADEGELVSRLGPVNLDQELEWRLDYGRLLREEATHPPPDPMHGPPRSRWPVPELVRLRLWVNDTSARLDLCAPLDAHTFDDAGVDPPANIERADPLEPSLYIEWFDAKLDALHQILRERRGKAA